MKYKKTVIAFITLCILLCLAEVILRIKGALDFPIYQVEQNGHYSLIASQNGKFLNKNEWFVNAQGFNNDKDLETKKPYVVLIGDSVIYGGNPVDYRDRIGSRLEKSLSENVYSGAVGGWSLYNEIQFINKNMDIIKNADLLIIQYDNGDLSGLTKARNGSTTHPTEKPKSAVFYLVKKYIYPKLTRDSTKSELPPIPEEVLSSGTWDDDLLKISKGVNGKILFVLYPDKKALEDRQLWIKQTSDIKKFLENNREKFEYIDIAKMPQWNAELYRDGIHPNVEGNQVIADIIARKVESLKN